MDDPQPTTAVDDGAVSMQLGQEVRFAAVLYGGISLAIYINGVTQELLQLVRATAPDPQNPGRPFHATVDGTAAVYRKLGQLLGRKGVDAGTSWSKDDPIRTRFMVDILAGTSAGGINGIYLGKALANDQDMKKLQNLWIKKGDIAELLNDGKKLKRPFRQNPPQSLLSGWYMYDELLNAFEQMSNADGTGNGNGNGKAKPGPPPPSPYVDDLDVFVTTTDLRGLPFPLRLLDKVAEERRHRNVFRFRYRDGNTSAMCNDFGAENDPLLAFAARCTSAFPYAFEPVRASDAVDHSRRPLFSNVPDGGKHKWDDFFRAYRVPENTPPAEAPKFRWTERSFADGGYLDNKPFSYAIDTVPSRRAILPVDRKLLYIEPDPEELDWSPEEDRDRPNVIENVNAALSLSRYETIREDLERILGRNALIERVQRILSSMEDDVSAAVQLRQELPGTTFRHSTLRDQIAMHGAPYGGYHRLKVATVSDDLTDLIAGVAGFDADSDLFDAVRHLVRFWRKQHFSENGEGGTPTENEFLGRYDFGYRLRRLNFVLSKIELLSCLDDDAVKLVRRWGEQVPETPEDRAAFRSELSRLCAGLGEVHRSLRRTHAMLCHSPEVGAAVKATALDTDQLRDILNADGEPARTELLARMMQQPTLSAAFDALAAAVARYIGDGAAYAARECTALLDGPDAHTGEPKAVAAARRIVRAYYANFELYDLLAFPIVYSTAVGDELDPIEVVRVSPQDVTINPISKRKLGGTTYGHFGAFLKEGWRRSDILWGRMHGAERLITVLLRGTEYTTLRDQLIAEAHEAIVQETFEELDRDNLCTMLSELLAVSAQQGGVSPALYAIVRKAEGTPVMTRVEAAMRSCLTTKQLYEFYKTAYQVDEDVDRRMMSETVGRATQITGKMLSDVAKRSDLPSKPALWLARLGSGITALVELAVPTNVTGDIGRRLLALLVFVELFLIAGGWVGQNDVMTHFGLRALVATVIVWVAKWVLGDFIVRGGRVRRTALAVGAMVLLVLGLLTFVGTRHWSDDANAMGHWLRSKTQSPPAAIAKTSPR